MTRPRLTWRVPEWAGSWWGTPLPAFRAAHGDDLAEFVEEIADRVRTRRERPSMQDVKRTLREIAVRPGTANVSRLDPFTKAAIESVAWKEHREWRLSALPPATLASCARKALSSALVQRGGGRTRTDDLALMLVRGLLGMAREMDADAQRELVVAGLRACGLGYSEKSVERLMLKAGQVL